MTTAAIFAQRQTIGRIFAIFGRMVIALFTFRTGQRNHNAIFF
jgi:hypothetical protein